MEAVTNHMIDDKALESVELFNQFLSIFPCKPNFVTDDGREIYFLFPREQFAKTWERMANKVILKSQLPLKANVSTWSRGGQIYQADLVIEVKQ